MDTILSIEDMLSAQDTEYEVHPAWGGLVRIGSLTAADMTDWLEVNDGPTKNTAGIQLLVKSLVDKAGTRIGKPEHVQAFSGKNAEVVGTLVNAVLMLNGLRARPAAPVSPLAAAKHDSGGATSVASPIGSPSA